MSEELRRKQDFLRGAVEQLRKAGYGYDHEISKPIQEKISDLDDWIEGDTQLSK